MSSHWQETSATSCQLKWCYSMLNTGAGTVQSCHRTRPYQLSKQNFLDFHNNDKFIADRQIMQLGEWPADCRICQEAEQLNAVSDRQQHNRTIGIVPREVLDDPTTLRTTPTFVEIYFNNTCNMRCIYCSPTLSSKWQEETRQHGDIVIDSRNAIRNFVSDRTSYTDYVDQWWQWFDQNVTNLRVLNVMGGEPLIIDEVDRLFDRLGQLYNPKLELRLVSNINVPTAILADKVAAMKSLIAQGRIRSCVVTTSIDSFDKDSELQRFGLKLDLFRANMDLLLNTPEIVVGINSTVTALGVKHLPTLAQQYRIWTQRHPIVWSLNRVSDQTQFLDIGILPRDEVLPAIQQSLEIVANPDDFAYQQIQRLESYVVNKNSLGDRTALLNLQAYLTELDRRRKTDWRVYYPWLEKVTDNVV